MVIGLMLPNGKVLINPPLDTTIAPNTHMIGIAENAETFKLSTQQHRIFDETAMRVPLPHPAQPQRLLILGWNGDTPELITRLDRYLADKSSILLVGNDPSIAEKATDLDQGLKHLSVEFRIGDVRDRALLDALNVPSFDRVVVLSPFPNRAAETADTETLIVLLHLRDISERSGQKFPIVTELIEERNRNLVRVARVDDVIVSNQLVSLVLAQMSQDRNRLPALLGLINPDSDHLQLKPAEDYVALGTPVNFYTVVESAKRCGHLTIGYCVETEIEDANHDFGVRLNPNKAAMVTFAPGDRLIVVAKN